MADPPRLRRDLGWLWAGYVGRSAAYFGLVVVLTRALGTSGFGAVSLFLAVTLGVSQLAGSWPFLAVPVLSAKGRSIGAAFRPSAYVATLASAATLLVAIPVCFAVGIDRPVSVVAVVASTVALVGLQGIFAVQQTEGRMSGIAVLQSAERLLALLFALGAVVITGLGVLGAQVVLTAAAVLTFAAGCIVVGRRQELLRRAPGEMPDHQVSQVMGAVGAMAIVSVCSYGVAWADVFVLAAFRSDSDVGLYSLAYQVFSFVTQLASYWLVVALPEHSRSSASGRALQEQFSARRLTILIALWASLVAAGAIVGALLLPTVFGSGFEDTVPPLLLLLGGSGVFIAVYFALLPGLIAAGRSHYIAKVAVASVAINIGLDLALVPSLGVIGPALATFAQTLFAAGAMSIYVLGLPSTLGLFAAATPAAAASMALAADPTALPLLAVCVVAALATAAAALLASRRGGGGVFGEVEAAQSP